MAKKKRSTKEEMLDALYGATAVIMDLVDGDKKSLTKTEREIYKAIEKAIRRAEGGK